MKQVCEEFRPLVILWNFLIFSSLIHVNCKLGNGFLHVLLPLAI